jgi:hypothetical protein
MSERMAARKKTTAKKSGSTRKAASTKRRASSRRELIDTGTDKRYVRRGAGGQFKESDDVGRSLSADRRRKAKRKAKPGQGDRGDR